MARMRLAACPASALAALLAALALAGAGAAPPFLPAEPVSPELTEEPRAAWAGPGSLPARTNRLALEASPFLRSHAHDPIDWRPHGAEAFAEAARRGRPIFVSVGYAGCGGCAVMAEESFGDPEVGAALDAGFVPVLVDREASPELADAFARLAAEMGEPVGYPLHVFLLPDGSPFHAATFLPRHDRPGRPGVLTVLASVERAVASGGSALERRGATLRAALARELAAGASPGAAPGARELAAVVQAQLDACDPEWGGRLATPKRPTEPSVALLLRHARRGGGGRSRDAALRMLERMAVAPVRAPDGGFHAAADRRDWSEPEPERRLADNALLALAYLEGWQASGRTDLRDVARAALEFLLAHLRAPGGAFFARSVGEDRDAQIPTGANGLAISALARGGFALGEARFTEAAREAARFLVAELRGAEGLAALVADGRRGAPATLADHALAIAGLLDLLEADADPAWLDAAHRLQAEQDARLAHPQGGYFLTREPAAPGLPRPRHARDGWLPSGQGTAALNLLRLHALTGDPGLRARADALLAAFREELGREPLAHATLALALDARLDGLHEIVVLVAGEAAPGALLEPLRRSFVPNRVLLVVRDGAVPPGLAEGARLLAGKRALEGASTAFVCRDHVCASPARDARTLARQLARFTPLEPGG